MWTSRRRHALLVALFIVLPSCGGVAVPRSSRPTALANRAASTASNAPPESPTDTTFATLSRQGSSVALARVGGHLIAYVADRLARRLDVVDVGAHRSLGAVPLEGEPASVLVLADRRMVVSLEDRSALEILAVDPGRTVPQAAPPKLVSVGRGPKGVAVSEDGKTLAVTSTYAAEVTTLDASTMTTLRTVSVPRSPSGVVIDGGRAFVSHLAGDNVTVVDLARERKPREVNLELLGASQKATEEALARLRHASQGYALTSIVVPHRGGGEALHRIVVPGVSVDPGDPIQGAVYYGPPPTTGIAKVTPVVITIDAKTERSRVHDVLALSGAPFEAECLLPRGVASRESTGRLYVACRGIDQLLELDGSAADPMRSVLRRFDVSKGVTGVAVSDEDGLAVTFGEFDSTLAIVALDDGEKAEVDLSAGEPDLTQTFRDGRELFYRTNDKNVAFDGVGCATCHPDGNEDSLTWNTPEGPRQTPMLAGRLVGTSPYGWTREMRTLPAYIDSTVQRLRGNGLGTYDTNALAEYLEEMEAPPSAPQGDAERGAVVWERAGCGSCHQGGVGVDGKSHSFDIPARPPSPSDPLSANDDPPIEFDTPSLRFIGLTAPYFHDGRYKTLEDLLSDPANRMGASARLSATDRQSLVHYLEQL